MGHILDQFRLVFTGQLKPVLGKFKIRKIADTEVPAFQTQEKMLLTLELCVEYWTTPALKEHTRHDAERLIIITLYKDMFYELQRMRVALNSQDWSLVSEICDRLLKYIHMEDLHDSTFRESLES